MATWIKSPRQAFDRLAAAIFKTLLIALTRANP
jgi:hypothetical protein